MMDTIIIREYDQIHIRERRNIENNEISREDAIALQSILMDDKPVFKLGYKKLIAQQWVGNISFKGLNIEILPKIYGDVSRENLRNILIKMILLSHQSPVSRRVPGSAFFSKNSLVEILIDTFLDSLEKYTRAGIKHEYMKIDDNLSKIKGKIQFNKQFSRNLLTPSRFWCKYSKYSADNEINRFFKLCLTEMDKVTNDKLNKKRIKYLFHFYREFKTINKFEIINKKFVFNSVNQNAEESYIYGNLFLKSIFSTLSAGNVDINMLLFDMNKVYELFVYRIAHLKYGNSVFYQSSGNYLLSSIEDKKKYISLRPDIIIKKENGNKIIIDTKWKIPVSFIREIDAYQMNAYSTTIKDVEEVVLLYPLVRKEGIVNDYEFIDVSGANRILKIRTIDLTQCLDLETFIDNFESYIS